MCEEIDFVTLCTILIFVIFALKLSYEMIILLKNNYPFNSFLIPDGNKKFLVFKETKNYKGVKAKLFALLMILSLLSITLWPAFLFYQIYVVESVGC